MNATMNNYIEEGRSILAMHAKSIDELCLQADLLNAFEQKIQQNLSPEEIDQLIEILQNCPELQDKEEPA